MGASSPILTPGMVKIYSKPGNLSPDLLTKKSFIRLTHDCNKYTNEAPTSQWSDEKSFELEKLLYLNKFLENCHHKQLSYWYL